MQRPLSACKCWILHAISSGPLAAQLRCRTRADGINVGAPRAPARHARLGSPFSRPRGSPWDRLTITPCTRQEIRSIDFESADGLEIVVIRATIICSFENFKHCGLRRNTASTTRVLNKSIRVSLLLYTASPERTLCCARGYDWHDPSHELQHGLRRGGWSPP